MVVRSPVHRSALVGEVYILQNRAIDNSLFRILIFQTPNAVETVHPTDARPVFKRLLEKRFNLALVLQPIASHEVP